MEEDKKVLAEQKKQVENVAGIIDDRKTGGSDAIGEAEEDRLTRERHGRQVRGEHQDTPVSTQPVEPSVQALKDHKAGLENSVDGGEVTAANERMTLENNAGSLSAVVNPEPEVK
jgi:hypothetical protein